MDSEHNVPHKRPPYRPPIGIPARGEPRARATVASIALHVLIALLLLGPTLLVSTKFTDLRPQGAGGLGPAGGGGGGAQGPSYDPLRIRYIQERLDFVNVGVPIEEPPVEKKPEPEPPKPPPPPEPEPEPDPEPQVTAAPPAADTGAGLAAAAAGTGNDTTGGTGPGRGGGVGSGVGTGTGSGTGPGTGGGDGTIYPPTVVSLPILPLPIPSKVRPYRMVAEFEVDSLGNAKLISFNPSRDAAYNKRIKEMLLEIRFRPAVTADGRPVTARAIVTAEAL